MLENQARRGGGREGGGPGGGAGGGGDSVSTYSIYMACIVLVMEEHWC